MLVFLLACREPAPEGETGEGEAEVEHLPGLPDTGEQDPEEAEFFDDTVLHTVAITLSEDAERSLHRDPYEFVDGTVVVDGATLEHVGIRLRGKIGSFRDLSGKPKFKIDFNRFRDQRLGDHEALSLNNEVVDCSYLREPTGYAVFRQLGLPAPRTAYTLVTVNGEAYGLYVAVEYPDDRFLARHYADPSGNLYDGKYLYWESGSYQLIDFTPDQVGSFQLEEGTDVDLADVTAISDAILAEGTFEERLGGLVDTERFHLHVAAEQWIGHVDGYTTNTNNYRVYVDPEDGRAEFVTYDHDYAFYTASSWGMNWSAPAGVLVAACWADADCLAAHRTAVASVVATVDTDALLTQMDTWAALIADAAIEDPRRECLRRQVEPTQDDIRSWVAGASEALGAYWAGR